MNDNLPEIYVNPTEPMDTLEVIMIIDTAQEMEVIPDLLSEVVDTAISELPFGDATHGTAKEISPL